MWPFHWVNVVDMFHLLALSLRLYIRKCMMGKRVFLTFTFVHFTAGFLELMSKATRSWIWPLGCQLNSPALHRVTPVNVFRCKIVSCGCSFCHGCDFMSLFTVRHVAVISLCLSPGLIEKCFWWRWSVSVCSDAGPRSVSFDILTSWTNLDNEIVNNVCSSRSSETFSVLLFSFWGDHFNVTSSLVCKYFSLFFYYYELHVCH